MNLYKVTSNCLGKEWALLAESVEGATGIVIRYNQATLKEMEAASYGDLDLDIRVNTLKRG